MNDEERNGLLKQRRLAREKCKQLQSNWNSLRELIIKEINNTKKCIEFNIKNNLDCSEYKRDIVRFEFILEHMNELEGKK